MWWSRQATQVQYHIAGLFVLAIQTDHSDRVKGLVGMVQTGPGMGQATSPTTKDDV